MAFPTIPTSADGRILATLNTAGGATKTFPNLSSLTKTSGDLLIAICVEYDGNSTNAEFSGWGGGFTEFVDQAGTATMAIGAAYKWSDGAETGTFNVTTADTTANDSVLLLISIPGTHGLTPPEGGTIATGTGAAANPGSFNPAGWDVEDTLWIAVGGAGEDATTGAFDAPSAAPASYGNLYVTGLTADAVGGVYGALAFRQSATAAEDVGTFTVDITNARNSALLIAVRPTPVYDPNQQDPRNYRGNIFFRPSGEPFHTLGDTEVPAGPTPITLDDTGAETDDLTVTAAVPLSDTAAESDAVTAAATVPLADTGAETDALTATAAVPLTDTGTETDAVTAAASVPITDVGAETDALTVGAAVPLDDTGAGADVLSVDTGITTDADQAWPQIAGMFLTPEIASFQLLGETAPPAEAAISLPDSAAGDDALTVAAAVPLTDTGAGTDALSNSATLPLTDTGAETDAITTTAAVPLTDTGTGTDALSNLATVPLSDSGAGADALTAAAAVPLTDAGAGSDALTTAAAVPLSDTGAETDQLTVASVVPLDDAGTGADALAVNVGTHPDQAWPQVPGMFAFPEAASFQLLGETSITAASVGVSDTGAATDSMAVTAAVPLTDTAAADDTLTVDILAEPTFIGPLPFPPFGPPFLAPHVVPFQLQGDTAAGGIPITLSDTGTGVDSITVEMFYDPFDPGTSGGFDPWTPNVGADPAQPFAPAGGGYDPWIPVS